MLLANYSFLFGKIILSSFRAQISFRFFFEKIFFFAQKNIFLLGKKKLVTIPQTTKPNHGQKHQEKSKTQKTNQKIQKNF